MRATAAQNTQDLAFLSRAASAIGVSLNEVESSTEEVKILLKHVINRLEPAQPTKVAPKPRGLPVAEHWHITRESKVKETVAALFLNDRHEEFPVGVVALVGPGGAGKTRVAATVARSDQVRTFFCDGILWMSVGDGAIDRLQTLILQVAEMMHGQVMGGKGRPPPEASFPCPAVGASYIRRMVEERNLRCLLVADNVWDAAVVDLLLQAGLWVLLTTRDSKVLDQAGGAIVDMGALDTFEAEQLLRQAAELEDNTRLPHVAYDVMERCDFLVMDISFVGRWSDVRGSSEEHDWQSVLDNISRQDEEIRKEEALKGFEDGGGKGSSPPTARRHAILRAGFEEMQNKQHRHLYMSLAVFPKGSTFSVDDVAVLLHDTTDIHGERVGLNSRARAKQDAKRLTESLEGWAILGRQGENRYSLHDAHADFVKRWVWNFPELRERCIKRWCLHLCTLDFVLSCDWYVLQGFFRAVEALRSNGEERITRAYDAALSAQSNCSQNRLECLRAVSFFYLMEGEYEAVDDIWRLHMVQMEATQGCNHPDFGRCLLEMGIAAILAGRVTEAYGLLVRALEALESGLGLNSVDVAQALHALGMCTLKKGLPDEAEKLYHRALEIRVEHLGSGSPTVARTLNGLGRCALESGKLEDAKRLFQQALDIEEAVLSPDHPDVTWTLHDLGTCQFKLGRIEEAKELLGRVLKLREITLGREHPDIAYTLHELGACAIKLGQVNEAEELFGRALDIRVLKLGEDHCHVAITLNEIGRCAMMQQGRLEEARALFQRSYNILTRKKDLDTTTELSLREETKTLLEAATGARRNGWQCPAMSISILVLVFAVPVVAMVVLQRSAVGVI